MLNFRFWRKAAIDISITTDQRILSPAMNRRSNPRYGAHNSSRKSALSALYLAAKLIGHCNRFNRSAKFHMCVFPCRRRFKIHRERDKKLNKIGNARIGFMSLSSAGVSNVGTVKRCTHL